MRRHNTLSRFANAAGIVSAWCLVVACALPGAQVNSPAPPSAQAAPTSLPQRTAWQDEILNLEPDGTRSLESALTLFAMAFGPIPGVAAPPADVGTVGSASPAVRVIRERRDELTEEQRAAVDQYLAAADDAATIDIPIEGESGQSPKPGALALAGAVAQLPEDPFERDMKQLGQQARRAAAPYFGEIPDLPAGPAITIRVMDAPDWNFQTFFVNTFGPGGFGGCKVFVNRANVSSFGVTARSLTLDVIHCYQSWSMGSDQGFDGNVPAWAWEGPAEYIMLESFTAQEDDVLYLATYILLPDVSLFERSYDAVGYYAQAQEAGVDLSAAFKAVLTDVDNPERFALAGTTSNVFLDKWASELVRWAKGEWGPDWQFLPPQFYLSETVGPMQAMGVANGSLEAFSQDPYSNHLFAVSSAADIVKVEAMGRARVGDGTVDAIIQGSAVFCTTDKGCGPCPDGSDPPMQRTHLAAESVLAVSGGTDGTNGTISGHSLEEFCKQTPKPSTDVCPDGQEPPTALQNSLLAVIGGLDVAQAVPCPSPEPRDEFCRRYLSLQDWLSRQAGTDFELTQAWAAEIARRARDMRPYAPDHLIDDVELYMLVYGRYARVPEPFNVPIVGPDAVGIANAFMAMNEYCGITF